MSIAVTGLVCVIEQLDSTIQSATNITSTLQEIRYRKLRSIKLTLNFWAIRIDIHCFHKLTR